MTPTQTQPKDASIISMKLRHKQNSTDLESTHAGREDLLAPSKRCLQPALITMSVEIFALSRKDLLPNPKIEIDQPQIIMYEVLEANYTSESEDIQRYCGCLVLKRNDSPEEANNKKNSTTVIKKAIAASLIPCAKDRIIIVDTEHNLFSKFIDIVKSVDPDFMLGYDVQSGSLGWLISRGNL